MRRRILGGNLMVGRNGVFYDHKRDDWDCTVTRIIEKPIGITQAFWAPHKRFVRMIEEQAAKRASAADEEARQKTQAAAAQTAHADAESKAEPTLPPPRASRARPSRPRPLAAIGASPTGLD